MAHLIIVYWRDIPAQVIAERGRGRKREQAKVELKQGYEHSIDAPHLERAAHAHRVAQLVLGVLAAQRRAVERLRAQDALDLAARRAVAEHQELERAPKPLAAQRAQRADRDRAVAPLAVREVRGPVALVRARAPFLPHLEPKWLRDTETSPDTAV